LANEIEPLIHLTILDGDDDGCYPTSKMIEEDHKPFSFLLQQQTSEMTKTKCQSRLCPHKLGASHDISIDSCFFRKNRLFLVKDTTFSKLKKSRFLLTDFLGRDKTHDFFSMKFSTMEKLDI
jgi:hypothetical protein